MDGSHLSFLNYGQIGRGENESYTWQQEKWGGRERNPLQGQNGSSSKITNGTRGGEGVTGGGEKKEDG